MWFLTRFLSAFGGLIRAKPDACPASEAPGAPSFVVERGAVARFVFQARELNKAGLPKPLAFKPFNNLELQRQEVSVCGLHGVTTDRMWELGRTIRKQEGLNALAAIEVTVAQVRGVGALRCEPAPEPNFLEHGVIVGWPSGEENKDARLALQADLAAAVTASAVHWPPEVSMAVH